MKYYVFLSAAVLQFCLLIYLQKHISVFKRSNLYVTLILTFYVLFYTLQWVQLLSYQLRWEYYSIWKLQQSWIH